MNATESESELNRIIVTELAKGKAAEKSGQFQSAAEIYVGILKVDPHCGEAHHRIAKILEAKGLNQLALSSYKLAVDSNLNNSEYWISYILFLIAENRNQDALTVLRIGKVLSSQVELLILLEERIVQDQSVVNAKFLDHKKLVNAPTKEEVEEFDRKTKDSRIHVKIERYIDFLGNYPGAMSAWRALATYLGLLGRDSQALPILQRYIQAVPDDALGYQILSATYGGMNDYKNQRDAAQKSISINPRLANSFDQLACAEAALGNLEDSISAGKKAIEIAPTDWSLASNLLMHLNYSGAYTPEDLKNQAVEIFGRLTFPRMHKKSAHKKKTIRIGFVSGDFKEHVVMYFAKNLFASLDRKMFELYAYQNNIREDKYTEELKLSFFKWTPVYGETDFDVAKTISNDQIDILIDLSGHTGHNRTAVFAYKPAPIQVSWLGYIATTGLSQMDYVLGDPYCAPPEFKDHFTEELWRLPETLFSMAPFADNVEATVAPAEKSGFITYGSFVNYTKITDDVMEVWCEVMKRVPESKFLIRAKQFADASVMEKAIRRFEERGINKDRIIAEGPSIRQEYWNSYSRVDFMLDVFPYPGITTSVEAYWAGVPVLTLNGDRFGSRLGVSIARNVGAPEWIAENTVDYVNRAVRFSADPKTLTELRHRLKANILKTPLYDSERFARHFGEAMQQMWQRWVDAQHSAEKMEQA